MKPTLLIGLRKKDDSVAFIGVYESDNHAIEAIKLLNREDYNWVTHSNYIMNHITFTMDRYYYPQASRSSTAI